MINLVPRNDMQIGSSNMWLHCTQSSISTSRGRRGLVRFDLGLNLFSVDAYYVQSINLIEIALSIFL